MTSRDSRWTAGMILIGVGLGFFFLQRWQGAGTSTILLLIGAAFLVAYLLRRAYGLLVPAGILLGLGLGGLLEARFLDDEAVFGLGCGFVFIYVVALLVERNSHWWPLIPGVILILVGVNDMRSVTELVFDYWPLALVAVGLLLVFGVLGGDREAKSG